MKLGGLALIAVLAPGPALAHEAFGDLGPFYQGLLHPLADPLQVAMIIGTAAFLARRPEGEVGVWLPFVVVCVAASHVILAWLFGLEVPPFVAAAGALAVGVATLFQSRRVPGWIWFPLLLAVGALIGVAPGTPPPESAVLSATATVVGVGVLLLLAWLAFDTLARWLHWAIPVAAGSWVAAAGFIAGAIAVAPGPNDTPGTSGSPVILEPPVMTGN